MSKKFNLLLLHQTTDIHPRSWICLKGLGLKTLINRLEKDALETHEHCRESLSRALSTRLHCSFGVIKRILQGKSEFYPVPIILGLSKLSRNGREILKNVKENIEYLKVNSASAKPVKVIYGISENLAKILGAFMADGSLSIQIVFATSNLKSLESIKSKLKKLKIRYSTGKAPSRNQCYVSIQSNKNNFDLLKDVASSAHCLTQTHYSIELTDEYKDNVESFIKWVKKDFGINPNCFKKRGGAWRASFSNKILARYLMTFFNIEPSYKAYCAFEPKLIKKSDLKTRKAFAKGVLMFDGCVSGEKKILFATVSQDLFISMKQIWEKDNIKFGKSITQRKGGYSVRKSRKNYTLFTLSTTLENRKEKLLKYFEPNTQKWKLLNWLYGNLNHTPLLKTSSPFVISLEKIMQILKRIKICDTFFLKNYLGYHSYTHVRSFLKILKDQGKIKLSIYPTRISKYVNRNTTVLLKNKLHNLLFLKIREEFGRDKNCAKFLGIHKATFSAWRVRKNRMPLHILEKICKILNFDFNKVYANIERTDREIIAII